MCCRLATGLTQHSCSCVPMHNCQRKMSALSVTARSARPVSLTKAAVGPEEAAMAPATALSTHANTCRTHKHTANLR